MADEMKLETKTVSELLLESQKAIMVPVMEAVMALVKEEHPGTPLTTEILYEKVLGMKAPFGMSVVVHTPSLSTKKEEPKDETNGCQRPMSTRVHDLEKRGKPCGRKVYVNSYSGESAIFCSNCMNNRITFRAQVAELLKMRSLTWEQATAGKMSTPVVSNPRSTLSKQLSIYPDVPSRYASPPVLELPSIQLL